MKTKKIQLDEIRLDDRNARTHDERNIKTIANSLQRFGQQKPIVVDGDGVVIAGNGTVEAARALGWESIQVVQTKLTGSDARAFAIADNRTSDLSDWHYNTLIDELGNLEVDMQEAIGFSEEDIAELIKSPLFESAEVEEDEAPEPPVDPVTKTGDLIVMGDHRLLCGDSTSPEDVGRLLDGGRPGIMVTDPPYGVEYDPAWRAEVNQDGPNSNRAVGKVQNDDRADWSEAWQLFDGDVAYVWHAGAFSPVVAGSLTSTGFDIRYLIVWAKQRHTFGRGHYHHQHEPCWCMVRKGKSASWAGDRKQTTLWAIDNNRSNDTGHGTQKPVECMARPMSNHDFDSVYDPFLGSGTTLIAAEQLGKACFGMEIDPAYCDVIVQRWEKLTGETAERIREDD